MPQLSFKVSDLLGQTPAPVQLDILNCTAAEIGLITGFAAGKTRGLCAAAIKHAVQYPNAKVLVGRKTFHEMIHTVKQPFFSMADPLAGAGWFVKPQKWDYREGTHHCRLLNGSQIFFSNIDDPVKFRNEEYSMVLVDQAEEIREDVWETLFARIRWAKVPPTGWQAIAAANDDGHNWVWRRFVHFPQAHLQNPQRCRQNVQCMLLEGHLDDEGRPRDIPCATRQFFHGTTLDNKHNLASRYLASLLSYPPEWQKHFIYATMEGGSGRLLPDPLVIDHVDPPAHWPRYRAIDHALNSPCCCLWIAINCDERPYQGIKPNAAYIYREYWREHASVDIHAYEIKKLSLYETPLVTVIDRSAFHKTQSQTGVVKSIADLYAEEGLICVPSTGDPFARVQQITLMHRRGMTISRECTNLIRQMPEYYAEQSKLTGEFKIVNRSDFHSIDALGYGLLAIPIDSRIKEFPDDLPEYLRRSGLERIERVHHTNEFKRIQKAREAAEVEEMSPLGSAKPSEFWGSGESDVELVTDYDPFGR